MSRFSWVMVVCLVGCVPLDVIGAPDGGLEPAPPDAALAPDGSRADGGARTPPGQVGGGVCDQQDDCDRCRTCSIAPFEQCNRLALLCEATQPCLALATCLRTCAGDDGCTRGCVAASPEGRDLLVELLLCEVCDACPRDCATHAASCEGALPF